MNKRLKTLLAVFLSVAAAGFSCFPVSAGWVKTGSGYTYTDENGKAPDGFTLIDGSWYYFAGGKMLTGWQEYDENWYYMKASGEMLTGWQQISGSWYYFYSSGRMASGWAEVGGSWYYFTGSGAMKTGWLQNGGKWYFFNGGGVMKTGWIENGKKWYFFDNSGVMQTGWVYNNSNWYYLDGNGVMQTGSQTIGGSVYTFSSSGMLTSGNPPASASAFDPETVRALLDGIILRTRSTADTSLNNLVSRWISSNIKNSMDNYAKVKCAYDSLLTFSVGEPDTSLIKTSGLTMDQLMDLYFGGPEYNARLLLAGKKGTSENFAAGFAALLRGMGFDAEVAEGIVYQDSSLTSGTSSSWVVLKSGEKEYIFDVAADITAGGGYTHFCRTNSELGKQYQESDIFSFRE